MVNSRLLRLDRFWMPAFQLGLALLTVLCFAPLAPAGAQDATGGSAGKDIEGVKEAVGVGDADVVKPAPEHEPSRLPGSTVEVYGLAMLDMGFQSSQNDPAWFDVIRPTKLPAFENEFGRDGHLYSGVRQSRLGVKAFVPTRLGELSTIFEFELFGVGADAGQTTIRLRHAYGELGQFGAGQTWSPFMDIDGFPNSIEYWGPNGMAFFRNVQVRWMPLKGDSRITLALERPGASGDQGDFADRIELQNISGHFPAPDFSAEGRWGGDWGYVELAGILRYLEWDDTLDDEFDLSGDGLGWGVNLSSNVNLGSQVLRLQGVYGEGIQNYMNDAPADVAPRLNPGDEVRPIEGDLLPLLGAMAFLDIKWNRWVTSSLGYSLLDIDNSDGQADEAFRRGHYALLNLLYYPVPGLMVGPEVQWGMRENFRDDFNPQDLRFQFSARYNFNFRL